MGNARCHVVWYTRFRHFLLNIVDRPCYFSEHQRPKYTRICEILWPVSSLRDSGVAESPPCEVGGRTCCGGKGQTHESSRVVFILIQQEEVLNSLRTGTSANVFASTGTQFGLQQAILRERLLSNVNRLLLDVVIRFHLGWGYMC